jgi:hypothetical protein
VVCSLGFPPSLGNLYPHLWRERRRTGWVRKRCGNEYKTKLRVKEMVDAGGRNVQKKKKKYGKIKRRMTDENEQNEGKHQRKFITKRVDEELVKGLKIDNF